jgi:hypothetical protein
MHPSQESLDLTRVRRFLGVPRYMVGTALADAGRWAATVARRDGVKRLVTELRLAYAAGYWREQHRRIAPPLRDKGLPAHSAC